MTDMAAQLFARMHEAYHAGAFEGACEFEIGDSPADVFHVLMRERCLSFVKGRHPHPTSRVKMPAAIARFLLDGAEDIDFRSPTLARHLDVQGDITLAFSLGLLLRRPSVATTKRFERASRISGLHSPNLQVARLHAPSEEQVAQCLAEQRPAVVTGALDHWEIPGSLPQLATRFGDCALPLDARIVRHRSIGDLVSAMLGDRPEQVYTHGCEIPAAMQRAFPPPFFDGRGAPVGAQLWMGHGGAGTRPVTLLHRDNLHGLLAQICGVKRILMYAPHQSELLYPWTAFNASQPCHVDPSAPDLRRYPLFATARGLEVRLQPGEILVNPLGWFHCVFGEGPVVSLSYSFAAEAA